MILSGLRAIERSGASIAWRALRTPPLAARGGLPPLVTLRGGMGQLVDALAESVGSSLQLGRAVASLQRLQGGWRLVMADGEPSMPTRSWSPPHLRPQQSCWRRSTPSSPAWSKPSRCLGRRSSRSCGSRVTSRDPARSILRAPGSWCRVAKAATWPRARGRQRSGTIERRPVAWPSGASFGRSTVPFSPRRRRSPRPDRPWRGRWRWMWSRAGPCTRRGMRRSRSCTSVTASARRRSPSGWLRSTALRSRVRDSRVAGCPRASAAAPWRRRRCSIRRSARRTPRAWPRR